MNMLIRLFEQYGYISAQCKEVIEQNIQTVHLKKGTVIQKRGQSPMALYAIEKGAVRGFYTKEVRTIDTWYAFDHTILPATYQMYKSSVANENIQCMEDCLVHCISNSVMLRLFREYPELNLICRRLVEEYALDLQQRAYQLQTMSVEQRYYSLLKDLGDHFTRVSSANMASYLGITEQVLSHIRRI
ncbi:Crp/Fnr family transcriptional regulator [Myroides pelagicus]|uniref:Crp/Fnr family transcriptional regulator n=1 Tax=Myroides pelagicus TaxID=270914 RepID=A0A7K1GN10_9FLAO|nr:Crp/Fnr family transcriptional regulator [Myroides pelagicus]MEC4113380.1 Crp/Fnr family transcriptional regulator [Myroides pelagicus]MTH30282.1 Crp/Fnr family transcriptional regulator [Myroides pelagicus]